MILRTGVFLQDRYEILEQIGSGGMSEVYKAKCHKLNRLVAIKVLKEEFSSDKNFVVKFKMEAQAAAGLSHPNIVRVYDVVDEGDLHYIVMELIEGITLKNYIIKKEKLDPKESIGIAIQVAHGIAAAHEQHIIHRDIKPQNMIISRDGKVKVADFGIARAVSAQTMSSAAMGSVHYISPEQARGNYSDMRSDIYSLGITMYEMVTGRLPFEGDSTVTVALAHLKDPIVPPSVYCPEIPVSFEKIILKCTEKKPENRYRSVNHVISDLRRVLLNPDEDFVRPAAAQKNLDETMVLRRDELQEIRQVDRVDDAALQQEAAAGRNTAQRRIPAKTHRPDDDDMNPHLEKLLAVAGVAAAVLVIVVLIFVFTQFKGLLPFGNRAQTDALETEATAATENGLDDTQVYMPSVVGLSEEMAEAALKEHNLSMRRTYEDSDDVAKGDIIRQNPEEGTVVSRYSSVGVTISNGSDKLDLTELHLESMDVDAAMEVLKGYGLQVVSQEEENELEKGKVLRSEPLLVEPGGTVVLYVSSGPAVNMIPVPNLVNKTEEEAIALLAESGLLPGAAQTASSDTVAAGSIISQSGDENGMIAVGGTVNYVVSTGPETSTQRYVASIRETYDLSNLVGPGAGRMTVTIMIRLHQVVNGEDTYKTLTQAKTITGSVMLPVNYTGIESAPGVDTGEVEVVDVTTGAVLKSYPLTFFPMD